MLNNSTAFEVAFSAIDGVTDGVTLQSLESDETLKGSDLNIVATPSINVGSAVFYLNGAYVRTENVAPYALFGDRAGDFFAKDLDDGAYALEVVFFAGTGGSGDMLGSQALTFNVGASEPFDPVEPVDPVPEFGVIFSVYDADSNAIIDATLSEGETLSGVNLSLVATPSEDVGSASFYLNGEFVRTENVAPYASFGNVGGDYYGDDLPDGSYTLEVVFHAQTNGGGAELGRKTLGFEVENDVEVPVDPVDPDTSMVGAADQIIFHFDGNNNDPDDISAMAVAALLSAASGNTDKISFFFGNNLSENNNATQLQNLNASADFAETLGIDTFGYQDGISGTTEQLVSLFESGQKVLSIEGGPMEAVYRALEQTDTAFMENITLLSHSTWNEARDAINRPGVTEARNWADIQNDFPAVDLVEIRDQNWGNNNNEGFNNSNWDFMDSSNVDVVQAARAAMEGAPGIKKNDASDAGMLWFGLTGEEDGTAQGAESFFAASGLYDLTYLSNVDTAKIVGEASAVLDEGNLLL